jgi:glutamate synthase (NADPH/NADH) small chain
MVIKAAGQVPFEKLIKKYKFDNKNGKIIINENCATNIKGVFAGGDAVNGGKEVVDAVEDGKKGAKAILGYLKIN